jgi:hypothetical protein
VPVAWGLQAVGRPARASDGCAGQKAESRDDEVWRGRRRGCAGRDESQHGDEVLADRQVALGAEGAEDVADAAGSVRGGVVGDHRQAPGRAGLAGQDAVRGADGAASGALPAGPAAHAAAAAQAVACAGRAGQGAVLASGASAGRGDADRLHGDELALDHYRGPAVRTPAVPQRAAVLELGLGDAVPLGVTGGPQAGSARRRWVGWGECRSTTRPTTRLRRRIGWRPASGHSTRTTWSSCGTTGLRVARPSAAARRLACPTRS